MALVPARGSKRTNEGEELRPCTECARLARRLNESYRGCSGDRIHAERSAPDDPHLLGSAAAGSQELGGMDPRIGRRHAQAGVVDGAPPAGRAGGRAALFSSP